MRIAIDPLPEVMVDYRTFGTYLVPTSSAGNEK
jgi:hypothetical protein